ncbi:MAG: hypothetical protein U0641_03280 [Anaerolineae bacterium]
MSGTGRIETLQNMTRRYFCTYFDRNYITRGLALYHSLVESCPGPFTLWILCLDAETLACLTHLQLPNAALMALDEIESAYPALARVQATRSQVEYYWTCTPFLPDYILRQHPDVDVITYLDADLYFFGDPAPIYTELGQGSILIGEHRYTPEHAYLAETSGIFNVGLLIFRQDERSRLCLGWWQDRCLEWCYQRYEDGKFGDQKYLDDWPARFEGVVVLQHKGAGLAPWNVARYRLKRTRDGVMVDSQRLIFYHYHSYRPVAEYLAQPGHSDYRLSWEVLTMVYLPYAAALARAHDHLRSAGYQETGCDAPAKLSSAEIAHGVLAAQWLLLRPAPLGMLLWRIGTARRDAQQLADCGFDAYAAGDLPAAATLLRSALLRNPTLLLNPGIVSIVLENWVGSDKMTRYRSWRHAESARDG